ncbi:septum formation initiator family protein [Thiomicrorhabdus sp.]|uniref:FtsB family cell division protein n=1 Tax=Thiomicrorhabdus sp. TaxID=2039724 RepID=UPI0029C7A134|nr:septum formation initiator family protein [Thiomicrorhabdus sp.]
MKTLFVALALILFVIEARLLSSSGGVGELVSLNEQLKKLEASLEEQRLVNARLKTEVEALQNNDDAIETIARQTLGMVKKDEVFVQVIELQPNHQSYIDQAVDDQSSPEPTDHE